MCVGQQARSEISAVVEKPHESDLVLTDCALGQSPHADSAQYAVAGLRSEVDNLMELRGRFAVLSRNREKNKLLSFRYIFSVNYVINIH
jgi:hypothetical protein